MDSGGFMSGPLLFHLMLGLAIFAAGVWLLRRRNRAIGWTLTLLGTGFAVMGVVIRVMHRYLHH
jgi:hypothetical protein